MRALAEGEPGDLKSAGGAVGLDIVEVAGDGGGGEDGDLGYAIGGTKNHWALCFPMVFDIIVGRRIYVYDYN